MRFSIERILFQKTVRTLLMGNLLSLFLLNPAQAKLDELYQISIGTYLTKLNANLALNSDNNSGVDLEDDLGFNSDINAGWFGGRYRVGDNHRIQLKYIPFNRSTSLLNSKDIIIDNTTIKAGASVNSAANIKIYDFSYIYSLYRTPKLELGLSAGLYILDYELEVLASGEIQAEGDDQPIFKSDYQSAQKLLAPMPLFGFNFDYEITANWRTLVSIRYFTLKVDRINGLITSAGIGTEYYWNKNWGIGATYSFFRVEIESESIITKSALVWEHSGIFLYAVYQY